MLLHKLLYQRQANAGIAAVIVYRQRLKHLEYLVMVFRRDTGTIIGYCEFKIFTLIMHRNSCMPLLALTVLRKIYLGELLVAVLICS